MKEENKYYCAGKLSHYDIEYVSGCEFEKDGLCKSIFCDRSGRCTILDDAAKDLFFLYDSKK